MRSCKSHLKRILSEDAGLAMAEYALLLGLIAVALVSSILLFRDAVINLFSAFP